MAEKSTFIKLDRNITKWRWYQDGNTFRVFVHLLLNANVSDHDFETITVHRGQVVISQPKLAEKLNMSIRNVRTSLNHLKSTGEVTVKAMSKYSVVTVINYDEYQKVTGKVTANRQSNDSLPTVNRQQYKNVKNEKNERSSSTPPQLFEISSFCSENGLNVNVEKFYDYYFGNGWKTSQGKPITDWKALLKKWSETEREQQAVVKKRNNNTLSGLPLLGSDDDD